MTCPKCGTENTDTSKFCVRCGDNLSGSVTPADSASTVPPLAPPPPAAPVEVRSSDEVSRAVNDPDMPMLAYFWAPWCGPCRTLSPVVESVARDYAGRLLVMSINTDEHPDVANLFDVKKLPALVLFSGRREVASASGAKTDVQVRSMLRRVL